MKLKINYSKILNTKVLHNDYFEFPMFPNKNLQLDLPKKNIKKVAIKIRRSLVFGNCSTRTKGTLVQHNYINKKIMQ